MKRIKLTHMFLIPAFLVLLSLNVPAQQSPNSIYFELFGNGFLYSVNYDRIIAGNIGARVGIMSLSSLDFGLASIDKMTAVPPMINYLSDGDSKIEIGAGVVFLSTSGGSVLFLGNNKDMHYTYKTAVIGYRYQPAKGGFLFRIGFTPIIGGGLVSPSAGISVGACF